MLRIIELADPLVSRPTTNCPFLVYGNYFSQ